MDHDGHLIENMVDESVDIEKIMKTQMMIESLRNAVRILLVTKPMERTKQLEH